MHLGNGIICPMTAIPMFALAAAGGYYAFKKAKSEFSKEKFFYTIALTCLVFALQMINFAIPQTGSSGHIIGTLLLSILLGPYVAFLSICVILTVQAIFFADGGILALGCNVFNMGVLACFVAYPFIYKPLKNINKPFLATVLACIVALQLGSLAAVFEGAVSGAIALNKIFEFTALMQVIHLPIGLIEGIFSAVLVSVVKNLNHKKVASIFALMSLVLAGIVSQYASQKPDGLEWSLLNIQNSIIPQIQGKIYLFSEAIQNKTSILANFESISANIAGLLIVSVVMFLLCLCVDFKKEAKLNAR